MKRQISRVSASIFIFFLVFAGLGADQRSDIFRYGMDLEETASKIAQSSFDHFKGWSGEISDQEQAILFKSEEFAAACRLFLRLAEERSDFFSSGSVRTNLFSAYNYLSRSFRDLENEMRRGGWSPYELRNAKKFMDKMDDSFSKWPSPENLAYLDKKYVKARNDTVYLIEKKGSGYFVRRPFMDLESLYRYNYDQKRGKNPWDHLVEVKEETLDKMDEERPISLTFEGWLIIEQSNRPDRGVFKIENGKKRGITSPQVLQRFGGWGRVYEVPVEIINKYPDGDPIS